MKLLRNSINMALAGLWLIGASSVVHAEVVLKQINSDEYSDLTGRTSFVFGNAGNDYITAGGGDDILSGNAGNDTIYGSADSDFISGGYGNDKVDGGSGTDWVLGGSGEDEIFGGSGNDYLFGGAGEYVKLEADEHPEITYAFNSSTGNVTVMQNGKSYGGDQMVYGTHDGNLFSAVTSGDTDMSSDRLTGGPGNDELHGGGGLDVFIFSPGDGADRIMDYELGETIDLTAFDSSLTHTDTITNTKHTIKIGDVTIEVMINGYMSRLPVLR